MRLLLYVVILQQIVVTIVRHCIQKLFLTPFLVIIFRLGSVLKQTKVFLFCMMSRRWVIEKECIRLTVLKRKKKHFYLHQVEMRLFIFQTVLYIANYLLIYGCILYSMPVNDLVMML